MGALRVQKGEYGKAKDLFRKAEQYVRGRFGAVHADTGRIQYHKALLAGKQGKAARRVTLLKKAARMLRRTAGNKYPLLAEIKKLLAE